MRRTRKQLCSRSVCVNGQTMSTQSSNIYIVNERRVCELRFFFLCTSSYYSYSHSSSDFLFPIHQSIVKFYYLLCVCASCKFNCYKKCIYLCIFRISIRSVFVATRSSCSFMKFNLCHLSHLFYAHLRKTPVSRLILQLRSMCDLGGKG